MISAIVDGVLLLALVVTTVRMVQMHRELRRVSGYHEDYQRIFDQTAIALDGIEVSVQEINVKGAQILNALGSRMDDARSLISEIDALTREAKRQQSVLRAELKELSEAATRLTSQKHFFASRDDLQIFEEELAPATNEPDTRFVSGDSKRPKLVRGARSAPSPARIHKIDTTYDSPFRAVSMNQKD